MNKAVTSILALGFLVFPLQASAQTASLDDKIKYILETGDLDRTFEVTFQSFRPLMIDQLRRVSNKVTPEIAEHIANIATEEFLSLKPQFAAFVANFYKKQLSEDEIGALYDFYKSPLGSSVGRKTSRIAENLIPQTQAFMQLHFAPKLQARLANDEKLRSTLKP
jgi:hypothetical protein